MKADLLAGLIVKLIVCKFGGTSLAYAARYSRCMKILLSDPRKLFAVASASGKRSKHDKKITDLLIDSHKCAALNNKEEFEKTINQVIRRFADIQNKLRLDVDLLPELKKMREEIYKRAQTGEPDDYAQSRGEYFSARILANLLGWKFVDAKDIIFFRKDGKVDFKKTYRAIRKNCLCGKVVIPGYYGTNFSGNIKVFSRGGSDITGSLAAAALNASLFENWTDVDGVFMVDPKIIRNSKINSEIEFGELRELAYSGASVIQHEAILPVKEKGIPILIKNTFNPNAPGTLIVGERKIKRGEIITGVASKNGNIVFDCSCDMLHSIRGIAWKILGVFNRNKLSVEHIPTGIDTVSVVVLKGALSDEKIESIKNSIKKILGKSGKVSASNNLSLVSVVGKGMVGKIGVLATATIALKNAKINNRMVTQGHTETNITFGVNDKDSINAVYAIYGAFMKKYKVAA
jgi:aspartate kinase